MKADSASKCGRYFAAEYRLAGWWKATIADEQAVSIEILGPCRSKLYDIRFEAMLEVLPVAVDELITLRSSLIR